MPSSACTRRHFSRSRHLALLVLLSSACSDTAGIVSTNTTALRVAILPDQEPAALESRFRPLIEYLETATGFDLELIVPASYSEHTGTFSDGSCELAWFGGLTFVIAEHDSAAEPLVMRDIDSRFASEFIALPGRPSQSLLDFKGKRLAFGATLSTSGHLMPRHFMRRRGIDPEAFFSEVSYASSHDHTVDLVRSGVADIGVVNQVILNAMTIDGRIATGELKVVETTPTYSNYVWAVQRDMPVTVKDALRDAFLALDPSDEMHRAILDGQGASGYLPAMASDFNDTRAAAEAAGLLSTRPP